MKETISNANFPKDEEDRVYHLAIKMGDAANRIITVGDPVRAKKIAQYLDTEEECGHPIFEKMSHRGFLTITGRYKGVPVTISAIGMGSSSMDFFMRETRAITEGQLAIIRFGSCGSLTPLAPPGAILIPSGGYCIRRNIDYFSDTPLYPEIADKPYLLSGVFHADNEMTDILVETMKEAMAPVEGENSSVGPVVSGGINADACSFYSSQARINNEFWDDNEQLMVYINTVYPETHSLEMEASMLFHLAHCAKTPEKPVKAAACFQVFADRLLNGFIGPEQVLLLEPVVGKACLDALIKVPIENEMDEAGTVWDRAREE
ncbi:nucleoside phosphorylase domain-containing protein [Pilobolus umbonatus]|nr:nucleoside phosphorylase domain-containing protein [Pilobolus umbonatus]